MCRIEFLREYARRLTEALHWIHANLSSMVEELSKSCPEAPIALLARNICDVAIDGVFAS